jgi:hypothetical protein
MHILLFLLMLLRLFGGITDIEELAREPREWPAVMVNGNPGVVAPRHVASDLARSDDTVEGYWLPGEDVLARAEDAVQREAAGIADPEWAPVLDGYRQYAGLIENGDRKIHISSMCTEIGGWRSSAVMVMDGGPCFWIALYNVDTDEIESLMVNGQA